MNAFLKAWKIKKIEDNIIKDIKNVFRLRKVIDNSTNKYIRNLFRLNKQSETIKDKIIKIFNLRQIIEILRPFLKKIMIIIKQLKNVISIEYKSNRDKNKNPSVKEYLNKIKHYLKHIIDLQKPGTSEIQLTVAINSISFKDDDEEQARHSKSHNIEIMTFDNVNKVIKEID